MIDRKPTHRTVRVFLGVLAMVSLLVPALALGQSGDWDQPQPLTVPTSTVATAATDHSWIYYSVNATAGQTILVTVATPGTDGAALMGTFEDAYTVEAAHSAPSTVSLTFMPSKTRSYLLAVSSGTPGTCSISATPTAAQPFQLSRVTASNTLSRAKTYPLSA